MRKLRLDVELLDVQSFNAGGIQPADLHEMSHGTCPKDCDSRTGCSCMGCGEDRVRGYALGTRGCDCYGSERC